MTNTGFENISFCLIKYCACFNVLSFIIIFTFFHIFCLIRWYIADQADVSFRIFTCIRKVPIGHSTELSATLTYMFIILLSICSWSPFSYIQTGHDLLFLNLYNLTTQENLLSKLKLYNLCIWNSIVIKTADNIKRKKYVAMVMWKYWLPDVLLK